MPFVNIYLSESTAPESRNKVSTAVHESLTLHFNVPKDDFFQVIQGIQSNDLKFPESYLRVPHTGNLVYIQIIPHLRYFLTRLSSSSLKDCWSSLSISSSFPLNSDCPSPRTFSVYSMKFGGIFKFRYAWQM
jgi:hypothetical protein